jgi:hypothetical protein
MRLHERTKIAKVSDAINRNVVATLSETAIERLIIDRRVKPLKSRRRR